MKRFDCGGGGGSAWKERCCGSETHARRLPAFPGSWDRALADGANRVLETPLEFALVPVCALDSSGASSAARPPLAGLADGGTRWDEIGDFVGIGRTGAGSCVSTGMPSAVRAGWLVGCAKDCFAN